MTYEEIVESVKEIHSLINNIWQNTICNACINTETKIMWRDDYLDSQGNTRQADFLPEVRMKIRRYCNNCIQRRKDIHRELDEKELFILKLFS